ncbi:hypothetical protein FACS1894169_00760 [Bacteroidia bacterium]|nr:hypothetical protein FACS1894169_00760 [Bacteroidia bacterium]
MGLSYRKRTKIAPGINLNISKSGPSISVGPKGAKINVGKKGVYSSIYKGGFYHRKKVSNSGCMLYFVILIVGSFLLWII